MLRNGIDSIGIIKINEEKSYMIEINKSPGPYNFGGLYIFSNPPGADIYLDHSPVRDATGNLVKAPVILTDIPEGLHNITFKMIGYHDDIVNTEVVGGYYSSVYGLLLPFPMPVPPT